MIWQPIETVPKGVKVLTYHDYGVTIANPAHPHFGKSGHVSLQASIGENGLFPSAIREAGSVTHWMPLPDPPSAA